MQKMFREDFPLQFGQDDWVKWPLLVLREIMKVVTIPFQKKLGKWGRDMMLS
jgi:hypothetical protein